jgi:hypothetical protein
MTGKQPPATIDHEDGYPGNDRWSNLRQATQAQQVMNSRARTNKSGLPRGVKRNGSGYQARVGINGRTINLGTYPTIEQAVAAYHAAAARQHGAYYAKRRS